MTTLRDYLLSFDPPDEPGETEIQLGDFSRASSTSSVSYAHIQFDWQGNIIGAQPLGWTPGVDGPATYLRRPLFSPLTYVLEGDTLWIGSWGAGCGFGLSPWWKASDEEKAQYMRWRKR